MRADLHNKTSLSNSYKHAEQDLISAEVLHHVFLLPGVTDLAPRVRSIRSASFKRAGVHHDTDLSQAALGRQGHIQGERLTPLGLKTTYRTASSNFEVQPFCP